MGARGAAYFISGDGTALLVGGDARPAARGELWPGGAVHVRDRAAFGVAGGAADLRAKRLVSGLWRHERGMGPHAAARPATGRIDHVDPGRIGLRGGWVGADGGVASRIGA